jgi:xanthine dehydrogenase iron-sulfur cluster and FAD-binding subunit A
MNFGTLNRLNDIEERIAALEGAVQALGERSASAEAVADIAQQVASLTDWRDSQKTRTLTLGNKDRRRAESIGEGDQA